MYLVGIAGGSGSGKTTFAKKIKGRVNGHVDIIHMDSYYLDILPEHIRTKSGEQNFDHPEAFDWELLIKHLAMLKNGESIDMPIYDFKTSRRTNQTKAVGPANVLIFEGIFALYLEEIRKLFDLTCFLHVDADIRFIRRLHRDVEERGRSLNSVIGQYYETVRPMHMKYLEPQKYHADIIVGEETSKAAGVVAAQITQLLHPSTIKSQENNEQYQ